MENRLCHVAAACSVHVEEPFLNKEAQETLPKSYYMSDFLFCPVCGKHLESKVPQGEHVNRLVCTSCNFVFYQNPKPTASIIIIDDKRILLVKRAIEPAKGEWDLPGGFVEEHEHPENTILREGMEELGVTLKIMKFLGIFMDRYGYGGGSTLNLYYVGNIISGNLFPNDDICECKWFLPDSLPSKMAFKNNEEAVNLWRTQITNTLTL